MTNTVIASVAIERKRHEDRLNAVQPKFILQTMYDRSYIQAGMNLILTNLYYTPFNIIMLTNKPEYFDVFKNNSRVNIVNYEDRFTDPIESAGLFNTHIKRQAIRLGMESKHKYIFWNDCDTFVNGWHDASYKRKCTDEFDNNHTDVLYSGSVAPAMGDLIDKFPNIATIIKQELGPLFYPELRKSPNPAETRVIFKNSKKLNVFLEFWDSIAARNNGQWQTYHDGIFFGTSSVHAGMKVGSLANEWRHFEFINKCKIMHGAHVLNFYGIKDETIADYPEIIV